MTNKEYISISLKGLNIGADGIELILFKDGLGADDDAEIHTLEVNDEMEDFVMKYLHQTKLKDKIRLHIGDALEIIPTLNCMFDLVFIDANKRHYIEYYNAIFDKELKIQSDLLYKNLI